MKKKHEDTDGLLALVAALVAAVLARDTSQATVDARIVADARVQAAFIALGKPGRARVFKALAAAKRRIDKEARERVELVKAKVEKLATDFVHMQLFELQGAMRDVIRQTPGIPRVAMKAAPTGEALKTLSDGFAQAAVSALNRRATRGGIKAMSVKELIEKLSDYGDHVEVAVEDRSGLTFHVGQVEDRMEGSSEGFAGIVIVVGGKFR